jgi:hypothetical protein
MKKKILKGLLFFMIGFILFFAFRLIYGYYRYDSYGSDNYYYQQSSTTNVYYDADQGNYRKNIASAKYESKDVLYEKAPEKPAAAATTIDQKYEKIGTLAASTNEFESTEQKVRDLIKKFDALIQYEQKSGLAGSRSLNLVIGVPPGNFDAMVAEVKKLGKLGSIQINKVDKTNEYKQLEAKRISLEKTIESLTALKTKGGKIDEYVNLEQQILDYQQQLQELGVELGDYDAENEFCTVKYNLTETHDTNTSIPLLHRLFIALSWTIKYYLAFVVIILLASLASYIIIKIAQALKWLRKPTDEKK